MVQQKDGFAEIQHYNAYYTYCDVQKCFVAITIFSKVQTSSVLY